MKRGDDIKFQIQVKKKIKKDEKKKIKLNKKSFILTM